MKKPVAPDFKQNVCISKEWTNSHSTDEHYNKRQTSRDEYKSGQNGARFNVNLLANSLTSKLKKTIQGDTFVNSRVILKLKRENLNSFVDLKNVTNNIDFHCKSNHTASDDSTDIRRQEHERRQSDMIRNKQDKIRSQVRKLSITQPEPPSVFPNITNTGPKPMRTRALGHHSAPVFRSIKEITFPSQHVDTRDASNVKVFKHQGIFQPHNKYSGRRSSRGLETTSILKKTDGPEYEILTLDINDNGFGVTTPQKKRKGLRVSWSGVERDMLEKNKLHAGDTYYEDDSRADGASTPNTVKSVKSDSALLHRRQSKRDKMESIGLKWKLPPGEKMPEQRLVRSAHAGQLSKNLSPVTAGLNKTGMSEMKVKWRVPQGRSLSNFSLYKDWLKKLERVKGPPSVPKPFLPDPQATEKESSYYNSVPCVTDPSNMSIYTASSNVSNVV